MSCGETRASEVRCTIRERTQRGRWGRLRRLRSLSQGLENLGKDTVVDVIEEWVRGRGKFL